ncbi:MAG: hypothetical protein LBT43_12530 [Prevotella sp.]|jgi:hypothetical protein|nr:hypothetical protein [Prevotella sp.]
MVDIYQEAGNIEGALLTRYAGIDTEVILPESIKDGRLHIIMEVKDDGEPNLWSYRRTIININEINN